ncbi:hypothetical protein [Streptomyces sp. NPDC047000]|uniref:hypothetical protein n=1 Tax=Streptomyces sp. NPDC047000 TaxID=3155474 RepID=UPI003411B1BF
MDHTAGLQPFQPDGHVEYVDDEVGAVVSARVRLRRPVRRLCPAMRCSHMTYRRRSSRASMPATQA